MNKTVVAILTLTVVALVGLILISFGPLANMRKAAQRNPASLQPTQSSTGTPQGQQPAQTSQPAQPAQTPEPAPNTYHNVDSRENFYTVTVPGDWQVTAGSSTGSYDLRFPKGKGTVALMDVPDNTTLELYLLSRVEPDLKRTVANYARLDYQKLTLKGNEAYELVYSGGAVPTKTAAVYVAGQDQAGVITLDAGPTDFDGLKPVFDNLINSFGWENR